LDYLVSKVGRFPKLLLVDDFIRVSDFIRGSGFFFGLAFVAAPNGSPNIFGKPLKYYLFNRVREYLFSKSFTIAF